ncbi:c-type cytochrome [Novosphingobium lentum]|uniref:c-type cytochrome n=1 Tax=Novosphingobium lentum TaxID=145287 RepID=UPI00082C283A|nr:c-type cytochrome [Novosphingobium lentum]
MAQGNHTARALYVTAAIALAASLSVTLAACGGASKDATATDTSAAPTSPDAAAAPAATTPLAANAAPASVATCKSCHAFEAGKTMIGPSLAGVVGRKAASLEGFSYSPALKAAGFTWDAANLDTWLTGPMKMVPGTRMVFAGIPDAAKRREVIEYLATLK